MAEEGAAVPPQAKGSWSSFLKVNIPHYSSPHHITDNNALVHRVV